MPLLLGAVADDYTGASDLANTLSRNGLSTIQTIGVPSAGFDAGRRRGDRRRVENPLGRGAARRRAGDRRL